MEGEEISSEEEEEVEGCERGEEVKGEVRGINWRGADKNMC